MVIRKSVKQVYLIKVDSPGLRRRWLSGVLAYLLCSAAIVILSGFIAVYALIESDLPFVFFPDIPRIDSLADYQPYTVARVYDRNGRQLATFRHENIRRELVPIQRVPNRLIQAFIASEDENFYSHKGLDYISILRALLKNILALDVVQGGSTITQQVTKSLLLTPERSITRKYKEAILATRIERRFSKQEILYLYINEIYFGHGAYGVQAAAQTYFGKDVWDLDLAECSVLAGLPKAPNAYSPLRHPAAAKGRQHYVLRRLREVGFITDAQYQAALDQPLRLRDEDEEPPSRCPYFVEYVRRYLMRTYGPEVVFKQGLEIYTTVDPEQTAAAETALDQGLRQLDKRQGWTGPLKHLDDQQQAQAWLDKARQRLSQTPPERGAILEALVTRIDDRQKLTTLDLGGVEAQLELRDMAWARDLRQGNRRRRERLVKPGQLLAVNDLIEVKIKDDSAAEGFKVSLEQRPEVQGLLLAMNPHNREVLVMLGGREFRSSQFNRVTQARRQPGSAFKPLVYAAALDAGYTPGTIAFDGPLTFVRGWRPRNYTGEYFGFVSLRYALARSINLVTIRLMWQVGPEYVMEYARRMGLTTLGRNPDLSMAIGSHVISPIELINAYACLAAMGKHAQPITIRRITTREGQLLESSVLNTQLAPSPPILSEPRQASTAYFHITDNRAQEFRLEPAKQWTFALPDGQQPLRDEIPPEARPDGNVSFVRVNSPQTAYQVTSMMQSVCQWGTAGRAASLGRVVAGKTGTTNDYRDAWFIGYSPDLLAGVWVGFDDGRISLGHGEGGSRAALPIWIDFMRAALAQKPNRQFTRPSGLAFVTIDKDNGYLPGETTQETILEVFKVGTAPTGVAPIISTPRLEEFGRLDMEQELPLPQQPMIDAELPQPELQPVEEQAPPLLDLLEFEPLSQEDEK
ncbi:MAG: PBP1A family penicillin-binding protein [Candidatus Alcyoniella australis]|nr:PBP1A family penicillin-binding protein [Candidatus Alcyoniella australis]